MNNYTVPVISIDQKPLMPTTPSRARKLIKQKEATPFFKLGIFCIRLNKATQENKQFICCGIDPGSKKEAYTLKSENHTFLNIQCDAVDWVKDNMESRKNMRRARRFRKTPCRVPRWSNRGNSCRNNRLAPSTKARWSLKLELIKKLSKIFPINGVIMEDIKAVSKEGKKQWNTSFSPLEVGKKWMSQEVAKITPIKLISGFKTSRLRKQLDLDKSDEKLSDDFSAHCVDSWVMANSITGGHSTYDNTKIIYLSPFKYVKAGKRRSLQVQQPEKGGLRSRQGGTRSLGFTKGSIVKYIGKTNKTLSKSNSNLIFRIGGYNEKTMKITLCSLNGEGETDDRISRSINPKDVKHLSYNRFKIR
jgi:hypothetical protein